MNSIEKEMLVKRVKDKFAEPDEVFIEVVGLLQQLIGERRGFKSLVGIGGHSKVVRKAR
jgi:hypothetical protein